MWNEKQIISQDPPSISQMRSELPNVAQACNKTDVSERAAAILINAALKDMGIVKVNLFSVV